MLDRMFFRHLQPTLLSAVVVTDHWSVIWLCYIGNIAVLLWSLCKRISSAFTAGFSSRESH